MDGAEAKQNPPELVTQSYDTAPAGLPMIGPNLGVAGLRLEGYEL